MKFTPKQIANILGRLPENVRCFEGMVRTVIAEIETELSVEVKPEATASIEVHEGPPPAEDSAPDADKGS